MINLKSSNKQILDELQSEQTKAIYWLIKKFGGRSSYERMRDKILAAATSLKMDMYTEGVEYNSPNGNRWLAYECAHYYPEAKAANTHAYTFCYYKTVNRFGAFVPMRVPGSNGMSALIFTPHFFQRFEERMGIRQNSPDTFLRFHQNISKMVVQYDKKDNNVLIRMPNAIGLGKKRKGDGSVFEVRTILNDNQLSNGQLRKTDSIRNISSKLNKEPWEITKIRLGNKNLQKEDLVVEMTKMGEYYQSLGEKPESVRNRMELYMWIGYIFNKMGYVDDGGDEFLKRFGVVNNRHLFDYIKYKEHNIDNFIDLCSNCMREMNLKSFDRGKARSILVESGAVGVNETLLSPIKAIEKE